MLRRMNATIDLAVGSILAVAAAAFGVVGLLSGLKNNSHSTQWFLGALIMGILAGAVLLDELRAGAKTAAGRYDAIAGVLLLLGALVVGTIGFIAGLANNSHAQTWLASGVVLAVLSLTAMADELKNIVISIAKETRTEIALKEVVYFPPSAFAPELVEGVRAGSKALGYSHRDIVSGAAHDAVYMARIAPTAMVFVPCEGGISHNEIENARAEDIAAGCNVLLQAVLSRAKPA